jgi:hypothetical protein
VYVAVGLSLAAGVGCDRRGREAPLLHSLINGHWSSGRLAESALFSYPSSTNGIEFCSVRSTPSRFAVRAPAVQQTQRQRTRYGIVHSDWRPRCRPRLTRPASNAASESASEAGHCARRSAARDRGKGRSAPCRVSQHLRLTVRLLQLVWCPLSVITRPYRLGSRCDNQATS